MSLIIGGSEIETVILKRVNNLGEVTSSMELDEVWCKGNQVYISTVYVPKPTATTTSLTYNGAV